jgi:hypothetical protein
MGMSYEFDKHYVQSHVTSPKLLTWHVIYEESGDGNFIHMKPTWHSYQDPRNPMKLALNMICTMPQPVFNDYIMVGISLNTEAPFVGISCTQHDMHYATACL